MEKICRACEIAANDELVKQMPMHTCGKDGPVENADALKSGMKEQDAAHSFEKEDDDIRGHHEPDDRPQSMIDLAEKIKIEEQLKLSELTRLRSELQQERARVSELKKEIERLTPIEFSNHNTDG